jgi:hypothetical protein
MKHLLSFLLFLILLSSAAQNQDTWIYGISDGGNYSHGYFVRLNYLTGEYDTLINLEGVNIEDFASCIDPFNGRYFVFGLLFNQNGNFHIIDLNDLTIESYDVLSTERPEYNIFNNSIIYDQDSIFYSYNLQTHALTTFPGTFSESGILWGKNRTYNPYDNTYIYVGEANRSFFYYIILDAFIGKVLSTCVVPWYDDAILSPEGLVADFETGKVFAHYNETVFSINPYTGDYQILLTIPTYYYHANTQIATYDQVNKKYIVPFQTINYIPKIAVIDMINYEVDTMYIQPDKWMDEQQIYCKPGARLNLIDEAFNSTYGENYYWFFNNYLLQNADESYLFPFEQGNYQVLVDFPAYSSLSNIIPFYFSNSDIHNSDEFAKVYPNPFNDKIEVEMAENNDNQTFQGKIIIYDIRGSKILEHFMYGSKCSINLESIKAGFYLVLYSDDKGSRKIGKILKIK